MHAKNGRPIKLEEGVPGFPRIGHLAIHKACDRFLAKRGLANPGFRRSEFLFGRMPRKAAA
jgi:hypothetical protein